MGIKELLVIDWFWFAKLEFWHRLFNRTYPSEQFEHIPLDDTVWQLDGRRIQLFCMRLYSLMHLMQKPVAKSYKEQFEISFMHCFW